MKDAAAAATTTTTTTVDTMETYGGTAYNQPMTEAWTGEDQDVTGYPNNLTSFEGSIGYPSPSSSSSSSSSSSVAYPYLCAVFDFAFFSVIQFFFLIFGLFGNSLSMFVFFNQKPLTPTAFLLINLGFYDNIAIIFYTLITGVSPICRLCNVCPYFVNTVYPNLVAMVWPFGTMGNMGGTMAVVCLTYHRFVGACYPHHVTRLANFRIARYQVAFMFAFVVAFNIPRFFDDYAYLPVNSSAMVTGWTALGNDYYFQLFYGGIVYYLLAFLVPFVLLIFMTYRLVLSLKKFHLKRDHQANRSHGDENAINKTLIIVVVVFMFAQLLNPIRRILVTVLPVENTKCGSFYYYFYIISCMAITIESSIHFTLYCLFDKRFRRQLKQWIGSAPTAVVAPMQGGGISGISVVTGVRPRYSECDPGIPQNR